MFEVNIVTNNSQTEFEYICADILNDEMFKKLNYEWHHGITRYEHSIRVAKNTLKVCKLFKLKNYKDITRAALLHDFYVDSQMKNLDAYQKLSVHPGLALTNAKKYYKLNKVQEDIIKNHMFPMTKTFPKTKEGVIVSLTDKVVAGYEMCHFKLNLQVSFTIILIANFLNVSN